MIAGTSASWYCMPAPVQDLQREERGADRRAEQHRERGGHPRDREAPRLDRRSTGAARASQLASVPHVVTSGASGPAAPPAEIVSTDIGTSERSERTLGRRRPTRGCCRRATRRRRGCRARARCTTTAAPTPPSTANCRARAEVLRAPARAAAGGSRGGSRRRSHRRRSRRATSRRAARATCPSVSSSMRVACADLDQTYRSTIYLCAEPRPPTT